MSEALATLEFQGDQPELWLQFLKRTRFELRELRKVRVWQDKLQILDINGDWFEMLNLGYPDPDIIPVLDRIGAAFNRETIHTPTDRPYKEFKTGRRYTWANDRVM